VGGGVNSAAQQQEQANQNAAEQYAAQQQQSTLAALQQYVQQNPSPASTAAPIAQPSFAAPKTLGGGNTQGGSGVITGQPGQQGPTSGAQPQASGQGSSAQINPQQAQALLAALKQQFGKAG
jgi:hypothetical protein